MSKYADKCRQRAEREYATAQAEKRTAELHAKYWNAQMTFNRTQPCGIGDAAIVAALARMEKWTENVPGLPEYAGVLPKARARIVALAQRNAHLTRSVHDLMVQLSILRRVSQTSPADGVSSKGKILKTVRRTAGEDSISARVCGERRGNP